MASFFCMARTIFVLFIIVFGQIAYAGQIQKIRVYNTNTPFLKALLQKVLETHSSSQFTIAQDEKVTTLKRAIVQLQKGKLDVLTLAQNNSRDTQLRAVRIPLLKGILGKRLLLIHKDDKLIFSKIKSVEELKKFTLGFGTHWMDRAIYEENNFHVVHGPVAKNLFSMLNKKRFQFFPRGLHEVYDEYKDVQKTYPDIIIAPEVYLEYKANVYFYVSKENDTLHSLLFEGLKKLMSNGEYEKLFKVHYQYIYNKAALENRRRLLLSSTVN